MGRHTRMTALMAMGALLATLPSAARGDTVDERIRKLEKNQAEIYHTLEGKKEAGLMTHITEKITLSGLIEVELLFEHLDLAEGSEDVEDIELATVQLGFEAEVTENIAAALILLYEEGGSGNIEVDEATVDYERSGWSGRIGRQYLPFGVFPSHFVADPLTLELGETSETALLVGYGTDLFGVSFFAAAGDVDNSGDGSDIDDWGASLIVTPAAPFAAGASYYSDLADTDQELVERYAEKVGAWSAYAVAEAGALELSGEYLTGAERFSPGDLDADDDGAGDRPSAWNTELAWHARENIEIAVRIEGSSEFFGQPELQYGACVSWGPMENVSVSLEYLRGEFDDGFGDGAASRDLVATQLAVEF